jgi:hypothetical protein
MIMSIYDIISQLPMKVNGVSTEFLFWKCQISHRGHREHRENLVFVSVSSGVSVAKRKCDIAKLLLQRNVPLNGRSKHKVDSETNHGLRQKSFTDHYILHRTQVRLNFVL